MSKKNLIVPKFTSETEDAKWHQRNRRALERAAERRILEGSTLTLPQAAARAQTRPVTLRLPATDIETARALAIFMELQAEADSYRDVSKRVDRLSKAQARGSRAGSTLDLSSLLP